MLVYRTLRRAAAVVVMAACCLVAGVGTAGAASEPPRPNEIVRGINLTADDLPGWEHSRLPVPQDRPAKPAPACPPSRLRDADATGWSEVFSKAGPVEIHSQVWVMGTPEQAAAEIAVIRTPGLRRCLAKELRKGFGKTVHITAVSVRPLKVHPPSVAGLRMRLGYDHRGRHGISVIDHRWFSYGRALVLLESSTVRMPYPAAKVDALQAVLFARAQALLPAG